MGTHRAWVSDMGAYIAHPGFRCCTRYPHPRSSLAKLDKNLTMPELKEAFGEKSVPADASMLQVHRLMNRRTLMK